MVFMMDLYNELYYCGLWRLSLIYAQWAVFDHDCSQYVQQV